MEIKNWKEYPKVQEVKEKFENEKVIFVSLFLVVNLVINDIFHGFHGLRFINIQKFPVTHNPFPVYHAGTDVFAVGCINDG